MGATVFIKILDDGLPQPQYAHPGDAGFDLVARHAITLLPFERALIPTGIALAIPSGFAGFVQPRSGLAIHRGFTLLNTPGLIDSGYRGEIQVIGINLDPHDPVTFQRGDKVAQMVIQAVETADIRVVVELDDTSRGVGGFGSTGV